MTPTQLHLFNALRCIYKYGKGQSFRWHFRFVIRARETALDFYYLGHTDRAREYLSTLWKFRGKR